MTATTEPQLMAFEMKQGEQILTRCQTACTTALAYCTTQARSNANLSLMCMLRDCAEMCAMCLHLMTDGSEFMGRTFLICAEMSQKCATACEAIDHPDMMDCAIATRQCAEYCQTMGRRSEAYFRRPSAVTADAFVGNA